MATSSNDTLKHHLSNLPNEKPKVCQIYNKDFNRSGHLDSHLHIHTKEKPHVCEICNKAFSRSGDLNIQVASGMPITECLSLTGTYLLIRILRIKSRINGIT
ncbi:UNVERIFIED_CONTAM: zinc finger protein [Trichonephila clavipes]